MSLSKSPLPSPPTAWPPAVIPPESGFYAEARINRARMQAQHLTGYSPADEQLLLAYEYQDARAFLDALKNGADPDLMNMEWSEPLLVESVYRGTPEVAELLLNAGADPTWNKAELLFALVEKGPTALLQRVLTQYHLSPNAKGGSEYWSLTCYAAAAGQLDCLMMLRDCGADVHADEGIALCMACRHNQPEIVRYLVHECQAPLDTEYDDFTPLFYAAKADAMECARILLEAGANPDYMDICNRMPFHYAASDNMHMLLSRYSRTLRAAYTRAGRTHS